MKTDQTYTTQLLQTPDRDLVTLADYIDKCHAVSAAQQAFRRENGAGSKLPAALCKSTEPEDVSAQKKFQEEYFAEVIRIADIVKRHPPIPNSNLSL